MIDLQLDNNENILKFESSSLTVNIKGKTNYIYVYSLGTGIFNSEKLLAQTLHFNNNSTGDAYLWAEDLITIEQYGLGNIIYATPHLALT